MYDVVAPSEGPAPIYSLPGFQEPFSAISHLFGAVLFTFLTLLVLRRGRGDTGRMIYLGVFAFSSVFLMAMSGVYHMLARDGAAHQVMVRLDHAAIFALIAGTFTPPHGILFRGILRWLPLMLIWGCAIAGITLKTIYFEEMPEWLGLACYLGMGWLGAISGGMLWWRFGFDFIKPLLAGGVAYSVGGLMEFNGWLIAIPGVVHPHEIFHIAVLVGAFCHWVFVWRIAPGVIPAIGMGPVREVAPSMNGELKGATVHVPQDAGPDHVPE